MQDKLEYSWEDFDNDVQRIRLLLSVDNWLPDYIVGVKRGGLIPAIKLSHMLNKPMIMMSCQLRDSNIDDIKLLEAESLPKNQNILVVDDICDSGITLSKIVIEFLNQGFFSIKTAALFYNTSQTFYVDYYSRFIDRSIDDRWIAFPWESK